jgi:hypothetical protein
MSDLVWRKCGRRRPGKEVLFGWKGKSPYVQPRESAPDEKCQYGTESASNLKIQMKCKWTEVCVAVIPPENLWSAYSLLIFFYLKYSKYFYSFIYLIIIQIQIIMS